MSDFLEEVLRVETRRHRAKRSRAAATTRRYAVVLTLLAGMTAVPSWIILKTGVNGLGGSTATPVQPLLFPVSPAAGKPAAASVPVTPTPVAPEPAVLDQTQPPPTVTDRPTPPILERRSVVDVPKRKQRPPKPTPPAKPSAPPSAKPSQPSTPPSASPSPSTSPSISTSPALKKLISPTPSGGISIRPAAFLPPGLPKWTDVWCDIDVVVKVERPKVERPDLGRRGSGK